MNQEHKQRCMKAIYTGGQEGSRPCKRKGTLNLNGFMYCPTHYPPNVEARRTARGQKQLDRLGEVYGLKFALETQRKTLDLVKADRDKLLELLQRASDMLRPCGLRDEVFAAIEARSSGHIGGNDE